MTEEEAERRVEEILLRAAADLAAIDDIGGMPSTVVIAYAAMDGEGDSFTGNAYAGSFVTAIGLLEATKHGMLEERE